MGPSTLEDKYERQIRAGVYFNYLLDVLFAMRLIRTSTYFAEVEPNFTLGPMAWKPSNTTKS